LGLGAAIAHGFFVHIWLFPSAHDAGTYAQAARDIVSNGLFSKFAASEVRTYGYPFFLSLVYRIADVIRLPFQFVLFELQLLLYLVSAFLVRNTIVERYPKAARIGFCGVVSNYYCLLYASDSLTESLSFTLLLAAVACWLRQWQERWRIVPLIAGSVVIGFAVMVRPANLFMVFAWLVSCALILVRQKMEITRLLALVLAVVLAVVLPSVPQMANNIRHYGQMTPLVVSDLGHWQQLWGVRYLKYATAMQPIPKTQVYYDNPFFRNTTVDEAAPWRWYLNYPWRGFLTVVLHTFNLTDQDLLFTYSRDLHPWYRLPLGVINHGIVALGILGLLLLGRIVITGRTVASLEAYVALCVLIGANWAIYALTAVEMRFGLVLLLVFFPFAGYAAIRAVASESATAKAATSTYLVAYIVAALLLSGWVRSHSAQIRDEPGEATPASPGASVDTERPEQQVLGGFAGAYVRLENLRGPFPGCPT
jgi:hypothetical protein